MNFHRFTFVYSLAVFGLSLIHISFALIGLACYISPVILYLKYKNKTWCQNYCPRAVILSTLFDRFGLHLKSPRWLTTNSIKEFFIYYVSMNFFFASMSTLMVYLGRIQPMLFVRLFMAFEAPFTLPQMLSLNLPVFVLHFSYRVFSMLFSSLLIGLVLGFLYAPRSWCVICPVNTLSVPRKIKYENTSN